MNAHTQRFEITGAAGPLECALDLPAVAPSAAPSATPSAAPRGIALVGHPHPLFGGSMDNKVAQTLARAFTALGYATARMNFRGVGKSAGSYDEGRGETDDMEKLLDHMQQRYPGLPAALAGFSFGTFVMAQLQQRLIAQQRPAERLALAGTAAGKWPMPNVPSDTILIHGELDDTIPLADVMDWARPQDIAIVVVPGAEHFFHRKLHHVKNTILSMWR